MERRRPVTGHLHFGALAPVQISLPIGRDAYLSLPEGWTAAPETDPSDQFMWAKFHAQPSISVASTAKSTSLKLPSGGYRAHFTPPMRAMDIGVWLSRISAPGALEKLQQRALVEVRFLQLFALHDGAAAGTLGDRSKSSGSQMR